MARQITKHALPADERHRIVVGNHGDNHIFDIHVRNRAGGDRLHTALIFDHDDNDGLTVRAVLAACSERLLGEDLERPETHDCPRTTRAMKLVNEALAELVARDAERAGLEVPA